MSFFNTLIIFQANQNICRLLYFSIYPQLGKLRRMTEPGQVDRYREWQNQALTDTPGLKDLVSTF